MDKGGLPDVGAFSYVTVVVGDVYGCDVKLYGDYGTRAGDNVCSRVRIEPGN